ncbi:hypothetical protein HDV57DRAFT_282296 [Trichoderma longibrachiatum]
MNAFVPLPFLTSDIFSFPYKIVKSGERKEQERQKEPHSSPPASKMGICMPILLLSSPPCSSLQRPQTAIFQHSSLAFLAAFPASRQKSINNNKTVGGKCIVENTHNDAITCGSGEQIPHWNWTFKSRLGLRVFLLSFSLICSLLDRSIHTRYSNIHVPAGLLFSFRIVPSSMPPFADADAVSVSPQARCKQKKRHRTTTCSPCLGNAKRVHARVQTSPTVPSFVVAISQPLPWVTSSLPPSKSEMQKSKCKIEKGELHTKTKPPCLYRVRCHVTSLLYQISVNAFHSRFFLFLFLVFSFVQVTESSQNKTLNRSRQPLKSILAVKSMPQTNAKVPVCCACKCNLTWGTKMVQM